MKKIFKLLILVLAFTACTDDERDLSFVENIEAPSFVGANFGITQDNSGLVTIMPFGTGATAFSIASFGDGSDDTVDLILGESAQHTYDEGVHNVVVQAFSLDGQVTEVTQELVVSFTAPENLEVNAEIDASNPFVLNVSPVADFATSFEVFFDTSDSNEIPTQVSTDGTVSFEYPTVGDYTIKVIALSGGAETTELTETISIASPTELPIDFEIFDETVFGSFGGTSYAVIDNPDTNGNDSSKVVQIVKGAPETWAGNVITLSSPIDFNVKKLLTMDVWSPRAGGKVLMKLENIDDGDIFMEVEATTQGNSGWETVSFDFSAIDTANTYQKIVFFFDIDTVGDASSDWTFYIDNIEQGIVPTGATGLAGTWKLSSDAGSLGVGPSLGDVSWWNCDDVCVASRACYYDDLYEFGSDGSFSNVLGTETWVEAWQGGADDCGVPVAPHDGSNAATYIYDEGAGTVTLSGVGAYIGLAKAVNGAELSDPLSAPSSIIYDISFIDNDTINVSVNVGSGSDIFWQYVLTREAAEPNPLAGVWQLSTEAGSLGVGPAIGDNSWWNCDDACVASRACYYDDEYVFGANGTFTNILGAESWVEAWQGGGDDCGAPVAPHDGSNAATYTYDADAGTLTVNGVGAYIGLPKAVNGAEITDPANAPASITYNISFVDSNTIDLTINTGSGSDVFWQYRLIKN